VGVPPLSDDLNECDNDGHEIGHSGGHTYQPLHHSAFGPLFGELWLYEHTPNIRK